MSRENKKRKILCLGDSLSLPGHGNSVEDTWYFKMQDSHNNVFSFFSFFRRAITTDILTNEGGGMNNTPKGADTLEFYQPNVVIMQLGIVDCAPRYIRKAGLLNRTIMSMPNQLKFLSFRLVKKVFRRSKRKADVKLDQFRKNLINYLERCEKNSVEQVLIIKICIPDESVQKKSKKLCAAINSYNDVYGEMSNQFSFVECLSPLDGTISDVYDDGYHPNPKGNDLVFQSIQRELIAD